MLPAVAAGTEFQSRLGEDAVLRARPAADAGGRERMAWMAVAVRKAEKARLPLEVRAAATRDAAQPGAAQREQRESGLQQQVLVLSALLSLRVLRPSVPALLLLRPALPEEVEQRDGVTERALLER